MKDIVIFDLDGTLADGTHRLHFCRKDNYNETWAWKPFNMACKDDAPIKITSNCVTPLIVAMPLQY